jgi:hypothetical protein
MNSRYPETAYLLRSCHDKLNHEQEAIHFYEEFLDMKFDSKHMNRYAKATLRGATGEPRKEAELRIASIHFLTY